MSTSNGHQPISQRGGPSKTLRFRKGSDLLAWYQKHAADKHQGNLTEALLVGLAYYRAAVESGTTQRSEDAHH